MARQDKAQVGVTKRSDNAIAAEDASLLAVGGRVRCKRAMPLRCAAAAASRGCCVVCATT